MNGTYGWQWTPVLIPLTSAGLFALYTAISQFKHKNIKDCVWITTMLLAGSLWMFGQVVTISRINLNEKIFWHNLEFLGNLIGAYAYVFFTLKYAEKDKYINKKTLILSAITPAIIFILIITNNHHHLFIKDYFINNLTISSGINITAGPLFWLIFLYNLAYISFGAYILLHSPKYVLYQNQSQILKIIGVSYLPVFIALADYYIDIIPYLHTTGISYTLSAIAISWFVASQRQKDTWTTSFHQASNLFREPYLLIDSQGTILDINNAAQTLVKKTRNELIALSLQETWSEFYSQIHKALENNETSTQVLLKVGKSIREYLVNIARTQSENSENQLYSIVLHSVSPANIESHELLSSHIELLNFQYITEALLNIKSIPNVMEKVASAIVTNYGFQSALIAKFDLEKRTLQFLACCPGENKNNNNLKTFLNKLSSTPDILEPHHNIPLDKIPFIAPILTGKTIYTSNIHSLLSSSVRKDTCRGVEHLLGVQQIGILPLRSAGVTRGMILVTSVQETIYEHQKKALARISNLAAIALENASLYQQSQKQARYQASLRQSLEIFVSTLNKEEILNRLAKHLCETLDTTSAHIFTIKGKNNKPEISVQYFLPGASEEERIFNTSKNVLATTPSFQKYVAHAKPCTLVIDDPSLDPPTKHCMSTYGVKSMLIIPLNTQQGTTGMLILWDTSAKRIFTQEEIDLAKAIAGQAAIALDNAELYAKAMQEIAERKEAEALLKQSEQDYRRLFENAHDAIIIFEPEKEIVLDVNQRACEIYKTPREQFIGQSMSMFALNPEQNRRYIEKTLQEGSFYKFETIHHLKDGTEIHLEINASLVEYHGRKAIISINRDITERKAFEEKLRYAALHDELTKLPNRTLFIDHLSQSITRKKREPNLLFAVLFLDLDNFKNINDTFGHKIGDKYLIEISQRLAKSIRQIDTIARFGGDEFAILLESIDHINDVYDICSRILRTVSQPVPVENQELITTTSIGVVISNASYQLPDEMLRDADIAMYRAKSKGGNRLEFFNEEMRRNFLLVLELEKDINQSILQKNFALYYQPIYNAATNEIFGLEALLRWQHPKHGLLLPADFLPVAEKTGLITKIDRYVFNQACKQFSNWIKRGVWQKEWYLSINISSRQMLTGSFLDSIEQSIEEYNLDPANIVLELTEAAFVDNFDNTIKILHRLRTIGFQVFLDDFGKGYSSLSHLNQLPINAIKIHNSFVQGIDSPKIPELITSMISIGHNLGLKIICEGVETQEQMDFIKRIGCDYVQGNYLHKPAAANALSSIFHKKS